MNNNLESTDFCAKYKELVRLIVQTRSEAKFSQQFLAEWIGVDRRKIIE